uniref:Uncharacterized protein n=1 Tax=viral metagenome TaxID=1070528 RepID=A0A6H1ZY45_9ZZZZ
MSDFCSVCGDFMFSGHVCSPSWKVYHEDYLDVKIKTVYAKDAETAAEKYGEYYDQDNPLLLDGEEIVVTIEDALAARKKFSITREVVREYSVKEVTDENN